jgi:TonB family protein
MKIVFTIATCLFTLCFIYGCKKKQQFNTPLIKVNEQRVWPDEPVCPVSRSKLIKGNVHTSVDELPKFPGGQQKLMSYVNTNLKYPTGTKEIVSRVIVTFIVNRDGSLSDLEISGRRHNALFEIEALRVVKKSPKWIPGKIKGKAVRTQYTVPILFQQQ